MLVTNVCSQLAECLYATFCNQTYVVVHHYEPECHLDFLKLYLQGQGHSVGLYNQNMTVSTIFY